MEQQVQVQTQGLVDISEEVGAEEEEEEEEGTAGCLRGGWDPARARVEENIMGAWMTGGDSRGGHNSS